MYCACALNPWIDLMEVVKKEKMNMTQLEADFCVVGAGISGMAAAYRLHKAGSAVIVLEAGDRIGGRIWTERLSNGTPFEIGERLGIAAAHPAAYAGAFRRSA